MLKKEGLEDIHRGGEGEREREREREGENERGRGGGSGRNKGKKARNVVREKYCEREILL